MVEVAESTGTAELEVESLQLDVKILQQNRDSDNKEFLEFSMDVNKDFSDVQKSLTEM